MKNESLVRISTATGREIEVPAWQLDKCEMEKFASAYYGEKIICDYGLIYAGRVSVVCRCRTCQPVLKVKSYFYFEVGFITDDEMDYGFAKTVFVPFSHVTAEIGDAKVCFTDGKLKFLFD